MPRQKLGQHFLASAPLLERIAAAACAEAEPLVIEIGPGRGALTRYLLQRARRVVAIEIDSALVMHLQREFAGEARLEIVRASVLDTDLTRWGPAAIAGNLPYYIATAILTRVATLGPAIRRGVFLIQKEVAERATARPGTRAYGYWTVELALFARVARLFEVKPGAFRPPPKVDSTVVRLEWAPRAEELGIADTSGFLRFVSACFRQKRKTVRNNLTSVYPKETVDAWPEASLRAERLSLEQLAGMYGKLIIGPGGSL